MVINIFKYSSSLIEIMESKLTLQEHVSLGDNLRKASDKLVTSKNKIDLKAIKLVNKTRSILEDIMFRDYGREGDKKFSNPNWWQDIYYGNAGRRD